MAGGNDPTQQTPAPPTVPKPTLPAQPLEPYVPTREQWAAAGYPPDRYDARFGPNAKPNLPNDVVGLVETALAAPAPDAQKKQAYFCLEANHPGQSTPRADHFDMGRIFYSDVKGAPICDKCRKQVTAIPVDDTTKLPPSLQAIADRLAVAERQR